MPQRAVVRQAATALALAGAVIGAAPGAALAETFEPPDVNDIRDLADLAERAIAASDIGFLQVGQDGRLTATSQGVLLMSPPPWQRMPGERSLASAAAQARRGLAATAIPAFGRIKTINRGSSVEVQGVVRGLVVRAGQLWVPTGYQAARPSYFVFDHRPVWFWTANQLREMGVEASYRPVQNLGLTIGGYNNKGNYKFGTLIVKSVIGRVDLDLGLAKAGGFLYYGTGRWWGDSTRVGLDLRTMVGPLELTGQLLSGVYGGIQQAGWYVDMRREVQPGTTLILRFDEHNPNLKVYSGLDTHATVAVMQRLSATRTMKVNFQLGFADPLRVQDSTLPSTWAVIGHIWQRF